MSSARSPVWTRSGSCSCICMGSAQYRGPPASGEHPSPLDLLARASVTLDGRGIRCHRLQVVKNRSAEAPIDVRLEDAQDPLVLVLDVGSTSSRAAVYDASAMAVRGSERALGHAFDARADGTVELD